MKDNRDLTTWTLAERVALAADWLAAFDPQTAAWIMAKAADEPVQRIDTEGLRKAVLRLVAQIHYPLLPRSVQARRIATDWAHLPAEAAEDEPGSINELLSRLQRSGVPPVGWRLITDLLDPMMDRRKQKSAKR